MSAPQVLPPYQTPSPSASVPRKRRRRAPATGAAADCFTCSGLGIACDRRRPYCSQCLDDGKDCSGYKTTLTWGVGVASRGKLRGLSLPIAGSKQSESSAPITNSKKRKLSGGAKPSIRANKPEIVKASDPRQPGQPLPVTRVPLEYVSLKPDRKIDPIQTPRSSPRESTTLPSFSVLQTGILSPTSHIHSPPISSYQEHVGLHSTAADPRALSSEGGMSSYPIHPTVLSSDVSYFHQPMQYSSSNPSNLRNGSTFDPRITANWQQRPTSQSYAMPPTSEPMIENHLIGNSSNGTLSNRSNVSTAPESDSAVEEMVFSAGSDQLIFGGSPIIEEPSPMSSNISSQYPLTFSPFKDVNYVGKTPRMRYLIKYFAEVIAPVIVAFDSPNNPYRTHILRLAAENETLQHAISALAASNLRQRRETGALSTGKTVPARRSSMAHLTLTDGSWGASAVFLTPQEQVREETYHKAVSIQSLNAQLADPLVRKDDSILATLLMLCLFHICDSGVAKFKTQFAGVKKLLGLRGNGLNDHSRETKWFTRMFTWFDAMTATVNDREGQLGESYLNMSAISDEEWALENLAGCDGQLFKIIAKLGRLNLLSQGQKVESIPRSVNRPLPIVTPYSNFDGNGWSRVIADEDVFFPKNHLYASKSAESDAQLQFWREWQDIRHALQAWTLDTSLFDSSSSEASLLTTEQRLDLSNISESFRYSALLYTERLASPTAASSDPNIQTWVQQSLAFIKVVKSDVFLLWPLFITGSECSTAADRNLIRSRCLDIQKDSGFYNNQSCLDLLEKVWKANPLPAGKRAGGGSSSPSPSSNGRHGAFKFTSIIQMEENDGEYIVV